MNERTAVGRLPKRNLLLRMGQFLGRKGMNFLKLLKKKNTYVEIICALLIILFIYTGLNKLMDYEEFKSQIERSPFIEKMNGIIPVALPAGEILLSLALVLYQTRLLALYLSFALMVLFTGYIWLMLTYAPDLPCSCGGIISKMSWNDHLIFNFTFSILALLGILLQTLIVQQNTKKFSPSF